MIGLILAAAGAGTRFGAAAPKQFLTIDGKPVYLHSLEKLAVYCDRLVVVVPADWEERIGSELAGHPLLKGARVVSGGESRQASVYSGLRRLGEMKFVLVHDAARPWISDGLIERVLRGARKTGACIPALPVGETVKQVTADGHVLKTLDRSRLRLAQTPQAFEYEILMRAFEKAAADGYEGTDEAALVERLERKVLVVEGDPGNLKITWPGDVEGAAVIASPTREA